MNATVDRTTWHGLSAWILENNALRTVIVPDLGGKLVSLTDKRSQLEWLVGPGGRLLRKIPYGAPFQEQDMSGWDEMFPTIVACAYPKLGALHGTPLPDHGEVWALPWSVDHAGNGKLTLSVEGTALPYRLTRTVEYTSSSTLTLHYHLVNLGMDSMPYIWAAHPQFACGPGARIVFPPQVTSVCNVLPESWGWGTPETIFGWPGAIGLDGNQVRIDRIGPPSLKCGRKFFALPDARVAWAGVVRDATGDWLRMEWDPAQVPYFGLWVDEGLLSHESVAAPEPMTGFYDSLAVAWEKQEVTIIDLGASRTWSLAVSLGTGEQPFDDES